MNSLDKKKSHWNLIINVLIESIYSIKLILSINIYAKKEKEKEMFGYIKATSEGKWKTKTVIDKE